MTERPSSLTYEDLIASGEGRMFGPGNAQLPLPPMLMFDRITSITADGGAHGKGRVVAEFDIRPDRWFFDCHFRGDPVMPGCLGLDAMWQLVGFFMGWSGSPGRGRALGVGEVTVPRPDHAGHQAGALRDRHEPRDPAQPAHGHRRRDRLRRRRTPSTAPRI